MSETLFIRFAPAGETASPPIQRPVEWPIQWLLADHAGGRLATVMQGALSEITTLAAGRRVIAIVPGCEALPAELELPAKNYTRLQQMAPFAMEEQLACDIDQLHFAIGDRGSNGKTPVIAIAHARMQEWLAALDAVGIAADAMYAESQLLPATPQGVTLAMDRRALFLLGDSLCGLTLDAQPIDAALALALPAITDTPVTAYVEQDVYEQFGATLDAQRERYANLQIKLLPTGLLPLFALQASSGKSADAPVDLQQGRYERRSSFKSSFAPWRAVAVLASIAVALHVIYNGAQLWRLARVEKQLDQQVREVVVQTLPGTGDKELASARRLFESKLTALQSGASGDGLLPGLSALGAALAQTPNTHIEALAYRNKTMDLRLKAPTVDALDRLRSLTQQSGMQTELQSTTPRDKNVEGRLQIKLPGA